MTKFSIKRRLLRYFIRLVLLVLLMTLAVVLPLRWVNPVTTQFILADETVDSIWINERWTILDDIAPIMQMAVIASEDQKFPAHYGFDFDELQKALSQDGGPTRGASTISQQLTKNLFLWSGKGIVRKGIEAYLTIFVELLIPKSRILELYLNVVEFGSGVWHRAS